MVARRPNARNESGGNALSFPSEPFNPPRTSFGIVDRIYFLGFTGLIKHGDAIEESSTLPQLPPLPSSSTLALLSKLHQSLIVRTQPRVSIVSLRPSPNAVVDATPTKLLIIRLRLHRPSVLGLLMRRDERVPWGCPGFDSGVRLHLLCNHLARFPPNSISIPPLAALLVVGNDGNVHTRDSGRQDQYLG